MNDRIEITDAVQARIDALGLFPRMDALKFILTDTARRAGKDDQLAPIWAEQLRHIYPQVLEQVYPDLPAANGDVLPIDSSVGPDADTWSYYMTDSQGYATWIDDDGRIMPNGSMTAQRFTGRTAEMGHAYEVNFFDLERAAKAGLKIEATKQKTAKRAVDAKTHWTWLFGDSGKDLKGLITHPNITKTLAPATGTGSSRLIEDKTNDQILADMALLINTIATQTIRRHHAAKVFLPLSDKQLMVERRLGAGDGFASLYGLIQSRFGGANEDDEQPRVVFKVLNECDGAHRVNPETGTDTSGITGRFWLACPADDKDVAAFIRARPFTQRPPQEVDFNLVHKVHSKIGGCKITQPLAFHRMDFLG